MKIFFLILPLLVLLNGCSLYEKDQSQNAGDDKEISELQEKMDSLSVQISGLQQQNEVLRKEIIQKNGNELIEINNTKELMDIKKIDLIEEVPEWLQDDPLEEIAVYCSGGVIDECYNALRNPDSSGPQSFRHCDEISGAYQKLEDYMQDTNYKVVRKKQGEREWEGKNYVSYDYHIYDISKDYTNLLKDITLLKQEVISKWEKTDIPYVLSGEYSSNEIIGLNNFYDDEFDAKALSIVEGVDQFCQKKGRTGIISPKRNDITIMFGSLENDFVSAKDYFDRVYSEHKKISSLLSLKEGNMKTWNDNLYYTTYKSGFLTVESSPSMEAGNPSKFMYYMLDKEYLYKFIFPFGTFVDGCNFYGCYDLTEDELKFYEGWVIGTIKKANGRYPRLKYFPHVDYAERRNQIREYIQGLLNGTEHSPYFSSQLDAVKAEINKIYNHIIYDN